MSIINNHGFRINYSLFNTTILKFDLGEKFVLKQFDWQIIYELIFWTWWWFVEKIETFYRIAIQFFQVQNWRCKQKKNDGQNMKLHGKKLNISSVIVNILTTYNDRYRLIDWETVFRLRLGLSRNACRKENLCCFECKRSVLEINEFRAKNDENNWKLSSVFALVQFVVNTCKIWPRVWNVGCNEWMSI